jgi:ATPase subunit of ABC transporter with duplicated ATPase domains
VNTFLPLKIFQNRTGPKNSFEGIYLSFYHKAKIGIVGENGSGKSTLLRIMAGVEKDFMGKAELKKGATLGYLPQEPRLDLVENGAGRSGGSLRRH